MSCCSCVPTGSLGVIQRFGEYQGLQEPGFRCICFPITTVRAVSLAVQQYECDTDCKTKDSVTVTVRTAVQYQIQKDMVKEAYFDIEEPMDQVRAEVGSVLRSTLPSMTLDESYEAKETMVEEILTTVRDAMKGYGYDIIKVPDVPGSGHDMSTVCHGHTVIFRFLCRSSACGICGSRSGMSQM